MKCHSIFISVWEQFESIVFSLSKNAAKMQKLPDWKIAANCIGWYCQHKVPVTGLLKHHYKYVTLRCFYA